MEDNINKIISKNLQRLMEEKDVNNVELGKAIGVSQSTVGKWLLCKSTPRMGAIESLAKFFDCEKSDILEDKSKKPFSLPSSTYKLIQSTAGAGLNDYEFESNDFELVKIPDQFLGKYAGRDDIVIIKANGESMNKIIPNQSYVGIIYRDYDYLPQTGDIIVYRLRGEGLGIKRFIDMYDEIMLKPESTEQIYKEQRFKKETADDFEILGKVVMYNVLLD